MQTYRIEPGTNMYEKGGLTYMILYTKANRIGAPVKASDFFTRPTLKNKGEISFIS